MIQYCTKNAGLRWVPSDQVAYINIQFTPLCQGLSFSLASTGFCLCCLNRSKLEVSSSHQYMLGVSRASLGPAPGNVYRNEQLLLVCLNCLDQELYNGKNQLGRIQHSYCSSFPPPTLWLKNDGKKRVLQVIAH